MSARVPASVRADHIPLLSSVVGRMQAGQAVIVTAAELKGLGDLSGNLNGALLTNPTPVPPETGRVYSPGELGPDDWVYYVQTPAVEWRVQGDGKATYIGKYQVGGSEYGYYLDNFQRVRDTYAGILVQ